MSYGIVRVQKMGKGSVKGIEIHDRREKDGISHTNKDIDWECSQMNYDLHPNQNCNFNQAVKQRISELHLPKAVRKDAVVMAQVLVTSDHDFFKGLSRIQQEQFFKDSYNFLADRYGTENVISATVHLDERTPHMHFNFVPVTTDGRLSAKSVLTRQSLIEQQTAFHKQVGRHYGLERGIQGGKKKHLEIAELKEQTALKNASKAQERVYMLHKQEKALEGKLTALQDELNDMSLSIEKIESIQLKKTITGAVKGTSIAEIKGSMKKVLLLSFEVKKLKTELEKTKRLVPSVESRMRESAEKSKLKQELNSYKSREMRFHALPAEVQRKVMDMIQPEQEKDLTFER